ncbi:MAG: hypothetical protein JNM98_18580 [Rhodocyclaceae bacterium]|nr:hypothetical protein [Rhodocyclaceae bacterium]
MEAWLEKLRMAAEALGWALPWAMLGRLIAYAEGHPYGRRRVIRRSLVWEIPIVVCSAKIGGAAADAIHLSAGNLRDVITLGAAYMGPQVFEMLIAKAALLMGVSVPQQTPPSAEPTEKESGKGKAKGR